MTAATNDTGGTYTATGSWVQPTLSGPSMYADTDGDFLPDWFENQIAHLDPNVADHLATHVNWDFTGLGIGYDTVVNNAGYTNLEICAEFYAGGFELIAEGTNDRISN